jgi:D-serine deaminase-like pyridoxal phosphate-dependent protein
MQTIDTLQTPAILINRPRLERNIRAMQSVCDAHRVELRPHIKTHKLVPVARMQLAAGARGLTCAKLGEAEVMLASGAREIFVAHSIVDPRQAKRIAALHAALDRVIASANLGKKLHVMMAVDTGLGREGVRSPEAAQKLATQIARSPRLELAGFYTHEGHFYGGPVAGAGPRITVLIEQLCATRDAIGKTLSVWPGCSVTAAAIASVSNGRIQAVRPGAYVFGDLANTRTTGVMRGEDVALHVLATVVDKPAPGLALVDAGSKTFSSDRTPDNVSAIAADGRDITVTRVSEEHGYLRGGAVDSLRIGERILFTPAHVCTVVNLAGEVIVTGGVDILETWRVEARGKTQ